MSGLYTRIAQQIAAFAVSRGLHSGPKDLCSFQLQVVYGIFLSFGEFGK